VREREGERERGRERERDGVGRVETERKIEYKRIERNETSKYTTSCKVIM
jgi:hypothetical protein